MEEQITKDLLESGDLNIDDLTQPSEKEAVVNAGDKAATNVESATSSIKPIAKKV